MTTRPRGPSERLELARLQLERDKVAYATTRLGAASMMVANACTAIPKVVKYLAWAGGAILCARALAGKVTIAHLVATFTQDLGLADWIQNGGIGILVVSLWVTAKNRGATIRSLTGRIKDLEKRLDPVRTSSALGPTGDTHPEDE